MTYLILGTGTDIGKSFLVENLCRILPQVTAIKPVCTGFLHSDKNSDPARILTALKLEISEANLNEISPWLFSEPCSPHFFDEQIDFFAVNCWVICGLPFVGVAFSFACDVFHFVIRAMIPVVGLWTDPLGLNGC